MTRPSLKLVRSSDTEDDRPTPPVPILGIDLGTTHSLVAVLRADGPQVLADEAGRELLPSAVALDDQGTLLVGQTALTRLQRDPTCGLRWFKRDMGDDSGHTLGAHTLSPTELSALVLRELKAWATAALGQAPTKAVITVPAYFQEPQRAATIEAGRLAGLDVVRLVNEPTAAAMAHGLQDSETERTCIVVDLGGGTLDVTVLEIFEGIVEIVASGGDGRLGGEDFTDRLFEVARKEAGLLDDMSDTVRALLRAECEATKRRLSESERVTLPLPSASVADRWQTAGELLLSRSLFSSICEPLLVRIRSCIIDTLAAASTQPGAIDEVLLVGGATRMPAVRDLVDKLFGKAPHIELDPDTTVALGAAVQAGLIVRDAAVDDLVVTDVLSHSLGVEVVRSGKDRFLPGYFLPVLHRNTTLPVRRVERVTTVHPQQKQLKIDVYQGEHRYVSQNRLLGSFDITDLEVSDEEDHRVSVDLAFVHDLNGLLQVEATVVSTGRQARILIEQRAGRLSPQRMRAARAALDRLNVHPRDLLPNRLLLEHAQTRLLRMSPQQRAMLDPILLAFEDALARQDSVEVAQAGRVLEEALAHPALTPDPPALT